MGFKLMSDQQRVRISLSETAFLVTQEDMLQFHVASRSSFMNTVFRNFHEEADSIRILRQSGHISKQEADRIQKDIANRNVQFLAGSDEQILVRLTEDGVRKYQSQIYLRPSCSQAITGEGDYSFFCTPRQAEYYFFKFGKDAEILSPPGLRERFLSLYADALKTYREPQGSRAS